VCVCGGGGVVAMSIVLLDFDAVDNLRCENFVLILLLRVSY
jgi:hypothetical protein